MLRRYRDTDHITGLRAIAALMVVMVHTGALQGFSEAFTQFTFSGRHGVIVFFVIAGFSVTASFLKSSNYQSYLIARFLRLAPLYYVLIVSAFCLAAIDLIEPNYWMAKFGSSFDAYNLTMHLTFLSFLDYRIASSILGVEWTLPIELFWYLMLPLLVIQIERRSYAALGIVLAIAAVGPLSKFVISAVLPENSGIATQFMPFQHGLYFALGVAAYYVRKAGIQGRSTALKYVSPAALLFMLIYMSVGDGFVKQVMAVCAATIIVFQRDDSPVTSWLLSCRPILFIGTISYSLYLLHFPVIALLTKVASWQPGVGLFIAVCIVSIVASTITYLAIERPTMQLGRWVARPR